MSNIRIIKEVVAGLNPRLINGVPIDTFFYDQDLAGFGVKVTKTGSKSFFVQGRVKGESTVCRIKLGSCEALSPSQARSMAKQELVRMAEGINPNKIRKEQKEKAEAEKKIDELTLSKVFENYCADHNRLKESTKRSYSKVLNHCLGDWMNKPIIDITKDLVEVRHKKLSAIKRSSSDYRPAEWEGKAQADQVMRVLRALFNYAERKYEDESGKPIIPYNPVNRLSQIKAWHRITRRQGVIKSHELKAWHEAVMKLQDKNHTVRDYLRLLLFTGLRKEEAAQLKWSNVDFNAKTIKVEDTKNGEDHMLPMSSYVYELLRERAKAKSKVTDLKSRTIIQTSMFVFPGEGATGHIIECRKQMIKVTDQCKIAFTLHDLRRTFATIAESQDIIGYTLKNLLNHKNKSDVTSGYLIADAERLRVPTEKITQHILSKINEKDKEEISTEDISEDASSLQNIQQLP